MLPDLSLIPALIMPAIAIGIIGLVQGAGVGQSYPNPDGKYPEVSRDFSGQGLANIATGFFQGIPGGGSMSGTAVSVNAGAKSRWANIFAGLMVAIIVLLFADAVKLVPMTALAELRSSTFAVDAPVTVTRTRRGRVMEIVSVAPRGYVAGSPRIVGDDADALARAHAPELELQLVDQLSTAELPREDL